MSQPFAPNNPLRALSAVSPNNTQKASRPTQYYSSICGRTITCSSGGLAAVRKHYKHAYTEVLQVSIMTLPQERTKLVASVAHMVGHHDPMAVLGVNHHGLGSLLHTTTVFVEGQPISIVAAVESHDGHLHEPLG